MTDSLTSPDPSAGPSGPGAAAAGRPPHPGHPRPTRVYGPAIAGDPDRLYTALRREYGPVAPVLLDGDVPAWFVLGYREVSHVTGNPRLFARDCRRWNAWDLIPDDWPLMPYVGWTPSVMFAEGPEHRRRAGAIGDALDAVDRTELADLCAEVSDGLIDAFAGRGRADLVEEFALRVPLLVMAQLYGLPPADIPALVADIAESLDSGEKAAAAHGRIHARMQGLVADRNRRPGLDVPSRLLRHPAGLTEDEVVIDLLVVMAAAQQPTGNWIGNTLRLMLTDDRFSVTLQGGRSSIKQALGEVLWENTPTQNFIGRWAVQDCKLGEQHIRGGDLVVLGLAAANTDPDVCPRDRAPDPQPAGPDGNQAHMSFGNGEHGCPFPAPELAEVIARTAVEVLLDRLPDVELAVPVPSLRWRPSVWMRGLFELPVAYTPSGGGPAGDGGR
ncbi:cytochrome P450 [Actinomadura parmotrematis]|uniref:Cytochrome P450 n=1 Tax=Actinomadura parmotrematis TaxID=2864039 RepID=A0ABS7G1U0_9ACTN|nr:cytochrome P450 [Actinomadura parmotrematis]MBW8486632.1 cytochrome P450 [Actinomadura parmotrematis]